MPVIMVSTLTERGAGITLEALEMGAVDYYPKPKENVSAALERASTELVEKVKSAGKVAITGYCWGGTVAWMAAAKSAGLACALPYYGGGIPDLIDEKPRVPTQCHFGELDKSPSPEKAKEVLAKHPEVQGFFYPGAGHGFNCDQRGSFNADSSKLARSRTLEFMAKHVG